MSNDAEKTQHSGRTGEFDISDMTDEEAEEARRKRRAQANSDDGGWQDWGSGAWGTSKGGKGGPNIWGADARWTGDKPPEPKAASRGNRTEAINIGDLHANAADISFQSDNRKYKVGAEKPSRAPGWNDSWGDDDDADAGSTLSLNLDDIQGAAGRLNNPILQKGSYNAPKEEDNNTYRAGQFNKLANRSEPLEAPISRAPSRGFDDNFNDDGGGWSPAQMVDSSAPKAPAGVKGSEATAAIDAAAFLSSTGAGAQDAKLAAEAARAHLIIFAPDSPDSVLFEIRRNVINIGRDYSNDVVLSDPYTSQKHVIIHKRGANFFEVEDAGTTHGTMVNGHFITRARLQHGDHIEIGATILRFVPGVPSVQDRIPSSAPTRAPLYTTPPPGAAPAARRSMMFIILVASLIMTMIAVGVVVTFILVID
jgi:hypothetical protein